MVQQESKRILIVKTSSMGDVIHMLPALTDMHNACPEYRYDWVVEAPFADIPSLHPAVDNVIPVAIRRWRKSLFQKTTREEIAQFWQKLRSCSYSLVMDTQGLLKSAAIVLAAKGTSAGHDWKGAREPLASCVYSKKIEVERGRCAIWRNREFSARLLGYSFDEEKIDYGLSNISFDQQSMGLPEQYILGLHASSRVEKEWSVSSWRELAEWCRINKWSLLLPWGTEREHQQAQSIADNLDNVEVLPKMSIAELAKVIQSAKACIGVDTGLVHLCAAFSKPTIALYFASDPVLTGARGGEQVLNLDGRNQSLTAGQVISVAERLTVR